MRRFQYVKSAGHFLRVARINLNKVEIKLVRRSLKLRLWQTGVDQRANSSRASNRLVKNFKPFDIELFGD
jgi:hypothetical protein